MPFAWGIGTQSVDVLNRALVANRVVQFRHRKCVQTHHRGVTVFIRMPRARCPNRFVILFHGHSPKKLLNQCAHVQVQVFMMYNIIPKFRQHVPPNIFQFFAFWTTWSWSTSLVGVVSPLFRRFGRSKFTLETVFELFLVSTCATHYALNMIEHIF